MSSGTSPAASATRGGIIGFPWGDPFVILHAARFQSEAGHPNARLTSGRPHPKAAVALPGTRTGFGLRPPLALGLRPTGATSPIPAKGEAQKQGATRMTKRAESKYKINRRLGVNLWGRPKSPINKREYGPGQHGQRRKKPTDFGMQLMAKQKLKGYYGNIGEKQFRKYYEEAVRRKGDTSENLIEFLERRLDAVSTA